MGLIDNLKRFLALEPLQTRTSLDYPDLDTQLAALHAQSRPWRASSVTEAIGVPAVFRAVSLIANTTGALSLEALRRGVKLDDTARPRIVVRPNPLTTPREFYRDTAWSMATRGEAWWWVAKRDGAGLALSLFPVSPAEVTVSENPRDLRYPIIEWRGRKMPNEDMRQLTLTREPGALRGLGPLQACGAALSVTVEAQEWAANFFASGGYPSVVLASEIELTEDEAGALKAQWTETPSNMPKVTNPGLTVTEFGANPQGAQMLTARDYQNGDIARMFGIPGSLLDHQVAGASLTYQNLEQEYAKFVRACLWPYYLEPIEQAMSDLLTNSTVARFNVDALLRADVKTRYQVYKLGVDSGVLMPEEARVEEGLNPGNIENAPVPTGNPVLIPAVPVEMRTIEVRCDGLTTKRRSGITRIETCNRLLSRTGGYIGRCPRCHKEHDIVPPRAVPAPTPITAPPVPPASLQPEAPAASVEPDELLAAIRSLPGEIAAVMPRQEPPVLRIEEGAIKTDVHLPQITVNPTVVGEDQLDAMRADMTTVLDASEEARETAEAARDAMREEAAAIRADMARKARPRRLTGIKRDEVGRIVDAELIEVAEAG